MNKKIKIDPNKYYLAENKKLWLNTLDKDGSVASLAASVFSYSKELEEAKDLEIVKWSKDDILVFYTSLMSVSEDRLKNVNFLLKAYGNWCIAEHILSPGQNHFEEIDYSDLLKCTNKTVKADNYILKETLLNWANSETNNLCDLAAIILLYEGVKGNHYAELLSASFKDINYKEANITLKSSTKRTVSFDPVWVPILQKASKENEYTLPSTRQLTYVNNNIVRAYRKDQLKDSSYAAKLIGLNGRIKNFIEGRGINNLSLNGIVSSGQINLIKQKAKEKGVKVSDFIVSDECGEMISEKYGTVLRRPKDFYQKYKNYLESREE